MIQCYTLGTCRRTLATKVDEVPCVPRTAAYQQHRDNVEHSSAEKYYRRTIVLPLLDHLVQQMEMRFTKSQVLVARLVNLVPSINATLLTFHMRKYHHFTVMIYLVLPWFPLKCGGGGKSGARKILLFVQKLFDKDFPPQYLRIFAYFCVLVALYL